MLNYENLIQADDIYNCVALAEGHPVYRIEGFGDDQGHVDALVVKLESGTLGQVRFASANMQVVDANARSKALTATEVAALQAWCGPGGLGDARALPVAFALRRDLGKPGTWIKMEVKRLVTLNDAVDKRLAGDKADIRLIAAGLRAPRGLETLGRIIAVDLFNGISDRFVYNPTQPNKDVGDQYPGLAGGRLHHLGNVGNVFVEIGPNGVASPVGLDNFDPWSSFKDPNTAVNHQWPGLLLADTAQRKRTFAGRVIDDLERLLGPRSRKVKLASTTRLGKRRKDRLLEGMEDGAARLRLAVRNYVNNNPGNLPAGITSRLDRLGW